jgi:hypothetical protein
VLDDRDHGVHANVQLELRRSVHGQPLAGNLGEDLPGRLHDGLQLEVCRREKSGLLREGLPVYL